MPRRSTDNNAVVDRAEATGGRPSAATPPPLPPPPVAASSDAAITTTSSSPITAAVAPAEGVDADNAPMPFAGVTKRVELVDDDEDGPVPPWHTPDDGSDSKIHAKKLSSVAVRDSVHEPFDEDRAENLFTASAPRGDQSIAKSLLSTKFGANSTDELPETEDEDLEVDSRETDSAAAAVDEEGGGAPILVPTAELVSEQDDVSCYTAELMPALPYWKQHARGVITSLVVLFVGVTAVLVGVLARPKPEPEPTPSPTPCPYLCDSCVTFTGQLLDENCDGCYPPVGLDGHAMIVAVPKESINFYSLTEGGGPLEATTVDIDWQVGDVSKGSGVAVSGNIAVVGSPQDNNHSGSVYVYENDPLIDVWVQTAQIFPLDPNEGAHFGRYVDVDAKGNDRVIVVGSNDFTGSAYIFRLIDGRWIHEAKLAAGQSMNKDFGGVAKVQGNRIAIGDRLHGYDPEVGIVYLYEYSEASKTWTLEHTITNKDCEGRFGVNLALANDRDLVVGCPKDGSWQGSAFVYQLIDGKYELQQKLTASGGATGNRLAQTQQIALLGDVMMIGEYIKSGGRAYLFVRRDGIWEELAGVDGPTHDAPFFGDQVVLSQGKAVIASSDNAYSYDLQGCLG